jgi:hypothetical protein
VRFDFVFTFSFLFSLQSLNEEGGIMSDLHDSLRLELHISLNRKLIENVPMFKMIKDHNCLIDLIEKLKPKIFIPGEYVSAPIFLSRWVVAFLFTLLSCGYIQIVLEGEVGAEMYVVVRGIVNVMVGQGQDRKIVASLKVMMMLLFCFRHSATCTYNSSCIAFPSF